MEECTCPHCGCDFITNNTARRYCGRSCKDRAKAERRYIPTGLPVGRPPERVGCTVPSCIDKHLARGLCRKHYRRSQMETEAPARPTSVVGSMASLHGIYAWKPKPVKVKVTVGVMAQCPACDTTMVATSAAVRICPNCFTTARLNPEEVSWLISEARSIEALQRIAN